MDKLKEKMFDVLLNEEYSALEETSQQIRALHITRSRALIDVLEEADMLDEYREWKADLIGVDAGEGVA